MSYEGVEVPDVTVRPYEGIGPVDFNMSREQVTSLMGAHDPRREDMYFYHDYGIGVGFDANGQCNWITCADPCVPSIVGITLVGNIMHLVENLRGKGYEVIQGRDEMADSGTFYCPALGLYLATEDLAQTDVDVVAAWREGYWRETGVYDF